VEVDTTFEEFAKWLMYDKQTFTLDAGNIKLTYNSVRYQSFTIFLGFI